MTSGTGLILITKCRCRSFYPAFLHLFVIFQHHIAQMTPSAAVYGHAGCITFHYLKFRRPVYIPFTNTAVWTCRVPLSTTSSVDVQGVSHSIACCVDVQVVYVSLFTVEKCFLNAGIPDRPASGQCFTGMTKNAHARTSPVLE